MSEAESWFLSRAQRGNADTRLDAGRTEAWTEGNHVTPLIDGATYFPRLPETIRSCGAGDPIWIPDWRGDADERLDGDDLGTLLVDAVERGVEVRGLVWRSHPDE